MIPVSEWVNVHAVFEMFHVYMYAHKYAYTPLYCTYIHVYRIIIHTLYYVYTPRHKYRNSISKSGVKHTKNQK